MKKNTKNNIKKVIGILAVLVIAATALAGCAGASQTATENTQPTTQPSQTVESTASMDEITLEEAKAIVFENLGVTEDQVTILKTETQLNVYDIEFIYGGYKYDIDIEKSTGMIVKYEKDAVNGNTDYSSSDIGIEEAKSIALEYVGASADEATIYKAELDNGVYEIEFIYGEYEHEVDVSRATGEVVNYKKEYHYTGEGAQNNTQNTESSSADISLEEAKAIALSYAGVSSADAVIYEAHLDGGIYEIEFYAGEYEYEVDVSRKTGEIVKFDKDYCHHEDHHHNNSTAIDYSEALSIAYNHAGVDESSVYDMEIELDDVKYEIEFKANGYEYEYEIALDGTILKSEKDRD